MRFQVALEQALDAVANVTIAIHDRNERPVISDTSRTIFENATIGTELGDAFTATDVDAGQTLTYIITSGAFDSEGGVLFRIDATCGDCEAVDPRRNAANGLWRRGVELASGI